MGRTERSGYDYIQYTKRVDLDGELALWMDVECLGRGLVRLVD